MGQAALKAGDKVSRMRRLLKFTVLTLVILHLLAQFLHEVPVRRYVATCGSDMFGRTYVKGPYNERFLDLLERVMQASGFTYSRYHSEIYIPYLGLSGDGYLGYDDFSLNVDSKVVSDIAVGVAIDGVRLPPPKPLTDLIAATEAKYGPFPRRNVAGERIYGPDLRFHDSEDACAFMRAAILRE